MSTFERQHVTLKMRQLFAAAQRARASRHQDPGPAHEDGGYLCVVCGKKVPRGQGVHTCARAAAQLDAANTRATFAGEYVEPFSDPMRRCLDERIKDGFRMMDDDGEPLR